MWQFFADHKEEWEQIINLVVFTATWALTAATLYYKLDKRLAKMEDAFSNFSVDAHAHWKRLEDELDRVEAKVDSHISSGAPHLNCPAHEALIKDMIARLDRVQVDVLDVRRGIREVEGWVIQIARNGKKAED
jgi:hypothetical protein